MSKMTKIKFSQENYRKRVGGIMAKVNRLCDLFELHRSVTIFLWDYQRVG